MDRRNLVLTGFMGTGKSAVGRAVARRLDREFVDMDEVLAARAGAAVAEIFARRGEAYFRACERALCAELGARENLVIATGGGVWTDPLNRAQFARARVVCLDASLDEILRRLEGARDRPLLAGDPRARIEELLQARREAYAAIPLHLDTTGRSVDEAAQQVLTLFGAAVRLDVRTPEGSYPVWLGRGLLDRPGEFLPRAEFAARCAVVTNPTVGRLYAGRVSEALRAAGFEPVSVEIPDGESYKNLETLRGVYDRFVAARLERRSPVLALGGGVVGDLAGFAAATFLRGVPFIQIPTTLLAMVDASVGGKVAVDHPAGKNLIGAYKFPHAVIADVEVLRTLPVEELRAGTAEVVKHAIIGDPQLFEELENGEGAGEAGTETWGALIERALRVKIDLVERDPFEQNVRAHLNLGHTFGHAFEMLSGYRLRHGYAVASGIAVAARLAARIGWCEAAARDRIVSALERLALPTRPPPEFRAAQIVEAMGADKKIRDGRLRLVLPRAIGRVEIAENVPGAEIAAALAET